MVSKIDRKICGTCYYWNGNREIMTDGKLRVAIFDEFGKCECPISSKSGEVRRKDLNCMRYEQYYVEK